MKNKFKIAIFVILLTMIIVPTPSFAADPSKSLTDNLSSRCMESGDCELNDFVRLGTNTAKIILGATGSLSLLMFVYGGVVFLTSAGNKEQVEKGKKIITGALIGIAIVFLSYTIIGYLINILAPTSGANWFSTGWLQ